jgi:hypothetical protein
MFLVCFASLCLLLQDAHILARDLSQDCFGRTRVPDGRDDREARADIDPCSSFISSFRAFSPPIAFLVSDVFSQLVLFLLVLLLYSLPSRFMLFFDLIS